MTSWPRWWPLIGLAFLALLLVALAALGGFGTHDSAAATIASFSKVKAQRSVRLWRSSPLPEIGKRYVPAIVIDPEDSRTVYAGTDDYGLFKSTDAGKTFRLFRMNFPSSAVAVDPKDSQTVYNGGALESELWKTTDGGQTWKEVLQRAARSMTADPRGGIFYVISEDGLYKTTDRGQSWLTIKRFPKGTFNEGNVVAIDPRHPQTVYLGQDSGGFKSTNGGRTWTKFSPSAVHAVAVDPRNTRTIYIGTERGTFKSTNGGTRWRQLSVDPRHPDYGKSVGALAIDPRHPTTIYAGTDAEYDEGGVYKSTDGGRTWRTFSQGLTDRRIFVLAVNPSGQVYAGTPDGFFSTA